MKWGTVTKYLQVVGRSVLGTLIFIGVNYVTNRFLNHTIKQMMLVRGDSHNLHWEFTTPIEVPEDTNAYS